MYEPEDVRNEFVKNCLSFQKESLSISMSESEDSKYTDFESESNSLKMPHAVVAPYFYMTESTFEDWFDLNRSLAKIATDIEEECNVFAAIVIDQGVLTEQDLREELVSSFKAIPLAGYLLWVDNLNEAEAGKLELQGYSAQLN